MANRKPLTNKEGEVRDLTADDFKHFRPAADVLSPALMARLATRRRGPRKARNKEPITIPLSREVIDRFRVTGEGWQSRLDAALQDWLKTHSPV
jgi:uncharacterized protein (DUF4415 family)